MDIHVSADGELRFGSRTFRCALGRGGVTRDKREGDGATPAGLFPLRRVLFRPDRVNAPRCVLPVAPIAREDGWCDDPANAAYNRQVRLPFGGRHEILWRDDGVYDLIVIIGHNDDPPIAGKGSAIFVHVARPDFAPTEGCVALAMPDLLRVLEGVDADSRVNIRL
jgi:L,D-peptidoglycan transpeptidase YkuD (ErfK/YbiS/YcfS/YnhG family)